MSSKRDRANLKGSSQTQANERDGNDRPQDTMSEEEMAALLAARPQPRYRGEPFSAWKTYQRQEPDKAFIDWKKAMVNEGPTRSNSARERSSLPADERPADTTWSDFSRRAGSADRNNSMTLSRMPSPRMNSGGKTLRSTNNTARVSSTEVASSTEKGVDPRSDQKVSPTRNVRTENVRFTNLGQR